MNATELAKGIASKNPGAKLAIAKDESAIGLWVESRNTFVEIYMKTILPSCPWVCLIENGMIRTTQCNGKELYSDDSWTPLQ